MPLSCRQQISDALLAALQSVASQLGANFQARAVLVERNRRIALSEDDLPFLGLFEGGELRRDDFTLERGYDFTFFVQAAIAGAGDEASQRANALRASLTAALEADVTLGGLASDLRISEGGDTIACDTAAAETEGFILTLNVLYATVEGDPFTFA